MSFIRNLALFLAALALIAAPASAHKKKHHQQADSAVSAPVQPTPEAMAAGPQNGTAVSEHATIGEQMGEMDEDRASLSTFERFLDWLGRLHPVIVHFPIAFFPAALFTAIVGRRRPAFGKPVQFLVVAGGIIAPIAALLGWLDAMNADRSQLLTVHRWLGTGVGIAGLALAVWAARKPEQDRGIGMIVALAAITAAIVVQGWYGGALVHGIDHMNW